jgi:PEP-CTERM motif
MTRLATRVCSAVLVVILGTKIASASNITFSPLPGPHNAPYGGHTEGGFTVMPISGNWFQSLEYGSPLPSIYDGPIGSPGTAAIQVTDTTLPFTFNSVDYSSNSGTSTFLIQGFLGDAMAFSEAGTLTASAPPDFGFSTLAGANPATQVDRLVIQVMAGAGVTSINLDNISVAEIPEPDSMFLLSLGCGLLAVWRRSDAHKILAQRQMEYPGDSNADRVSRTVCGLVRPGADRSEPKCFGGPRPIVR